MIRFFLVIIFFSLFAEEHTAHHFEKVAQAFEEKGDWTQALYWYLEAYQANPTRPDPLQKISSYYRHHGENYLAYVFAKFGNSLFSNYQFEEDLSIVSYYTQQKQEGFIAASHLMTRKDVPWWVREQASKNILFYVQNIPNTRFQPIIFDLPDVEGSVDEKYHPMNPSILKTDKGYKVICRTVNYTQTGAKHFHTCDPQGVYRTRNFLLEYDRDFQLLSQEEITSECEKLFQTSFVQGLEDCRIFRYEDGDWFACSTRDGNVSGVPQIVLCEMDCTGFVDRFIPLRGPDINRCEKNWMPFVKNGEICLIYSSDPFVVFRPNLTTGECVSVLEYKPELDFTRFRGSASPIEFDQGYLMLIHEVSFLEDNSRVYLHRFVYLDENLKVEKISHPFTFTHLGIEFCCGMTLNHDESELILTIGIEDNQAMFMFIGKEEVKNLLE